MNKKNEILNGYICVYYALCEAAKNKYFSVKLIFRPICHKNYHFFVIAKNGNCTQNRTDWRYYMFENVHFETYVICQ
jgi:hypothetical protein